MDQQSERSLITGGAGFIGTNLAYKLLAEGKTVRILDNFERNGVERNKIWLEENFGERIDYVRGDVRDANSVSKAMQGVSHVYHLAAQVAVTTSVLDPLSDFHTNALGTLNVLEAARQSKHPPAILLASTNKVYGGMEDVAISESDGRYIYRDLCQGVDETRSLDFHSPYGCSKGAADQYVIDYSRIHGLRTVVFRMSCIYGTRQFGSEDQGWIAHFVISAILGRPLTIYGDGKQIRDVLFVEDLVDAYQSAMAKSDDLKGQVFNIGGGPDNILSLRDLIGELESRLGHSLNTDFDDWRPGDQRVYVSDIRKAKNVLDWNPKVSVSQGVGRLFDWVANNRPLFTSG